MLLTAVGREEGREKGMSELDLLSRIIRSEQGSADKEKADDAKRIHDAYCRNGSVVPG